MTSSSFNTCSHCFSWKEYDIVIQKHWDIASQKTTTLSLTKSLLCCCRSAQRVEELEDALKKKDEDMKQMEERYKKYLEKAKSVSLFLAELLRALSAGQQDSVYVIECVRSRWSGP